MGFCTWGREAGVAGICNIKNNAMGVDVLLMAKMSGRWFLISWFSHRLKEVQLDTSKLPKDAIKMKMKIQNLSMRKS